MAKSTVTCATGGCGNTITMFGRNRKEADRKAEWAESQGFLCEECREQERQALNAKAAARNNEVGLPALTGTDKQIAWAETIREEKIGDIDRAVESYTEKWASLPADQQRRANDTAIRDGFASAEEVFSCALVAAAIIRHKTVASWWIDNRAAKISELILTQAKQVAVERKDNIPAALAAKAEATVRPEQPLTETVAEIRLTEGRLEVIFPEKREDFWQLIKPKMGFTWSGSCWQRRLHPVKAGDPADRLAEVGNRLLAADFPIRIYDDDIRARAISGRFEAECRRWIMAVTDGQYKDWFSIDWPKGDDFYGAAKRLRGSRYNKPSVMVPAEQFEEVLDFAESHGFRLSPGAEQLATKAKQARDKAMVATPVKVGEQPPQRAGIKPEPLNVPQEPEIDIELRDEEVLP